jgi:hypothetical protein
VLATWRVAIENRSNDDNAQALDLSTLQYKAILVYAAVCKWGVCGDRAIGWDNEM